mgnify:CR=1 FL=1
MTQVDGQRHLDRGGPGNFGEDRVGLEGPPRKDDLVTGTGEGMHELAGYLRRSSPHLGSVRVTASTTLGSGSKGFSLDDSFTAFSP